ncbi:MAG: reverse transcriptase family protein [Myxococcota bacterium]|nr:reverse transcriptase family protein [Myxococcota bacterium]
MSSTSFQEKWTEIEQAGGPKGYIRKHLNRRSYRPNIMTVKSEKEKKRLVQRAREEEARRKELQAYVWEVYTQTHVSHLGDDIFWRDFIGEDFFDPHERSKRQEEQDLKPIESVEELVAFLKEAVPELDISMLRWFCYHRDVTTSTHYRQFFVPKKSGGQRAIWAPLPRLKALQKLILKKVVEKMSIHGAAHGFVLGKSILSNAEEHTDSKVVVSIDLKDFFPSFSFRRVKGIFRSYGYPEGIATLLALICTEAERRVVKLEEDDQTYYVATGPRVLPQGSPASPALTNVASMRMDRRLSQYAANNGWRYTRYADDLTFSFPNGQSQPEDIGALLSMVNYVVKDEGFQVNKKKTHIMRAHKRQEVTGLVVNGGGTPRVSKRRRRMLRNALYNAQKGIVTENGLVLEQLIGHAAFVYAAQPELGRDLIDGFAALLGSAGDHSSE